MKKIFAAIIIACLITCFGGCKKQTDQFYLFKERLMSISQEEDLNCFKSAFRKAVEAEGIRIADDYISIWSNQSGFDRYGMVYNVLTLEGKYIAYTVDTKQIDDVTEWLYIGVPIEERGYSKEQIATLDYYVDHYKIKCK